MTALETTTLAVVHVFMCTVFLAVVAPNKSESEILF